MTAHRDPDRLILAFFNEGVEDLPDPVYDEVRARIELTRQRAFIGPWRTSDVNRLLTIGLAAAAVVVIAIVGYQFLGNSNTGGPDATATPEPTVSSPGAAQLAAGRFESHGGQIELDASGEGSNVTGSMIYADLGGADLGGFTVDLQCTRISDGGLILIGGPVIQSSKGYAQDAPVGSNVAIVFQRGSPVKAFIHVEYPNPHEANCLTFLASVPDLGDPGFDASVLEPIVGAVTLRP